MQCHVQPDISLRQKQDFREVSGSGRRGRVIIRQSSTADTTPGSALIPANMAASAPPPTFHIPFTGNDRLLKLKEMFISKFGSEPLFYARAPGRVNLIGEHIDYCGYAVLPMAVEQDILAAVQPFDSHILHLCNTNPTYLDFSLSLNDIEINKTKPLWHSYFLCGLKGIQEHFNLGIPKGMNCLVDGTIPPSSGLSSSSALVCCAGLATLTANGKSFSKVELAETCTKCERYIGTEGGGMDQSISFLAEEGTILAKSKGLDWKNLMKLGDVQSRLGVTVGDMLAIVEQVLHPESYTREEVCETLGVSLEDLCASVLSQNTQDVSIFKLYQRAKHVYSEAARVLAFKKVCDEAPANAVQLLGDLMNQSHVSCRDMYECSCTELDQLVDICLKSGAIGSRLTGAGWGGCTVSMVPVDKLNVFLTNVQEMYYKTDARRSALQKQSLFVTKPGSGAMVIVEKK
ncbi:N-acetylgalactosamine kinase isoform X5 [Hyla sarda]|uniref:N-acetylgalactosamine kinase isoform X5 n=1 Tax=Hyla sarda TaxID=327740 RepID=UPI0024C318B9|nr:N-acetylgalactosamine kinase isoform X5 [Hyla sarda]